ncbi:MAG: hypothetical protein IJD82_00570 [Clostridia bacterium]|nr:hypothetical protein [Clostridia bacterium]
MTKKLFTITLLLAVVLNAFAGCGKDGGQTRNKHAFASIDNESKFAPNEDSNAEEVSEEPLTGEFVVKDKKYTFEGNDLVIVSVENKTNKNYSVTVTGTYLDADGKTLKTETQTSDQYSAGFCQYFLFEPKMKFDKFTYTFETAEADGPFYAKDAGVKYNGIIHDPMQIHEEMLKENFKKYPTVCASYSYQYTGKTPINLWTRWLIVGDNGEILFSFDRTESLTNGLQYSDGASHYILHQTKDEDWECPEEWERLQAIVIYQGVTTDLSHLWPWQYPSW